MTAADGNYILRNIAHNVAAGEVSWKDWTRKFRHSSGMI